MQPSLICKPPPFGDVMEDNDASKNLTLRIANRRRIGANPMVFCGFVTNDDLFVLHQFAVQHRPRKGSFLRRVRRAVEAVRLPSLGVLGHVLPVSIWGSPPANMEGGRVRHLDGHIGGAGNEDTGQISQSHF